MPGGLADSSRDRQPVRRRLVCYLSGFDPKGPGHYHRMFSAEGSKQAALGGYELTIGPRQRDDDSASWWDVAFESDGETVHTRYEFWRWDDIVRQEWPTERLAVLRCTLRASLRLWRLGVFQRVLRLSWPAFVASAAPGLILVLSSLVMLAGVAAAAWLAGDGRAGLAGLALAGASAWVWWSWRLVLQRLQAGWLMRSLDSLVRLADGGLPQLDARMDSFARRLVDKVQSAGADEVLVVGHSTGAMLAMSVVARASRSPIVQSMVHDRPRLSLLTLGHCTPMLSLQPAAVSFRAELSELLAWPDLPWIDFTAPPDGCCFALVDPTRDADSVPVAPSRPKLLNPRFAASFDGASYRAMKADKLRCHFQYLMSGTCMGTYDYFLTTCGPLDLAARHASQASITTFKQFQRFGAPR